ncbi:unnamed protein product [Caenorhabditis auriculariae]|uniref:MYND-type domain-containing protein n=1 Tax=Caenorhabditis auriculariae TaxID=2777116 RepID=A0A8S1GQF1_9PELO|nr:unnamed protein product [Caenorhabditis auriculariae]
MSRYEDAMKYKKKIVYVVDRVFEKQLRSKESHEVMSLKLWIVLFVLREVMKFIESQPDLAPKDAALLYAKGLLKWEPGEEVRKPLDTLLRNCVLAFPYKQSLLYDTLRKALGTRQLGCGPATYDFILQALFGQRLLTVSTFCSVCGKPSAKKRCPACKLCYCSQECQKFDWPLHKTICQSLKSLNKPLSVEDSSVSLDDIQAQISNIDV